VMGVGGGDVRAGKAHSFVSHPCQPTLRQRSAVSRLTSEVIAEEALPGAPLLLLELPLSLLLELESRLSPSEETLSSSSELVSFARLGEGDSSAMASLKRRLSARSL